MSKSSMIVKIIEGNFVEPYYPTIETVFPRTVACNGTNYDCEIIDTAGQVRGSCFFGATWQLTGLQDEYSILGSKYAIGIHGYVLVYSVASRQSFDMIQVIYDKIIDFCGVVDIPCVIVGAKMDLQNSRQVPQEEGQRLAMENKAAWTETSARQNTNIDSVFELCLAEIEKSAPGGTPPVQDARRCVIM
ncbi:hypothetical protein C0991_004102 [Blastosporella zonata]|nr:hypothetical protein C0991_004102 [Blastosporella zonata]